MAIQLSEISTVVIINQQFGGVAYQVTLKDNTIIFVPNDPSNSDYVAVQEWLASNPA